MVGAARVAVVLDTHVAVWALTLDPRLAPAHRATIAAEEAAGRRLGISAISLWEIALLGERGRLRLEEPADQLLDALTTHPAVEVIPLTPAICLDSVRLPRSFPADPANRLITATARTKKLTLLTADEPIRASGVVRVG